MSDQITFQSLGLAGTVLQGVEAAGYTVPTPIQVATIPLGLAGRDVVGSAQTGTGKTAAFVLPILARLSATPAPRGFRPVRALVVTPTRELALQVEKALQGYGRFTGLRSLTIYGGVGFTPQLDGLRRGVDVVVATPGRLIDHLDRGTLRLDQVEVLVLDEADRMFDMGFLPAVKRIVSEVPKKRQTLLFSATMPPEIEALAAKILTNPETVEIGNRTNPAETVEQLVVPMTQDGKVDLLFHMLKHEVDGPALVFTRTKHRADRVAKKLIQDGVAAAVLHGGRSQAQRDKALGGFRVGRFTVLVATDVAARGIDVVGLSLVVNFDVPNVPEDYIHRIGRTGRADASGTAITFAAADEADDWRAIERHVGKRIERIYYDGLSLSESEAAMLDAGARSNVRQASSQRGNGGGGGRSQSQGRSSGHAHAGGATGGGGRRGTPRPQRQSSR